MRQIILGKDSVFNKTQQLKRNNGTTNERIYLTFAPADSHSARHNFMETIIVAKSSKMVIRFPNEISATKEKDLLLL